MAEYQVLRRIDAFVEDMATVEANSPAEAAQLARQNEEKYHWERYEIVTFDARNFTAFAEDGFTLLEETKQGDQL